MDSFAFRKSGEHSRRAHPRGQERERLWKSQLVWIFSRNKAMKNFFANQSETLKSSGAYSSFLMTAFTLALISRCNFKGISYSPTTLMGSVSTTLRLSTW